MDEEINVSFWEVPWKNVCFRTVEIEIAFKMRAKLINNFVTYYGAKIAEASESIVVVVQGVDETLDFS
jgi:hypothetical protein